MVFLELAFLGLRGFWIVLKEMEVMGRKKEL
jgi:hypothetical protein